MPNQQQWSIILETVSFGLVTLDLYGHERLAELTNRVNSNLSSLLFKINNSTPFVSVSNKNYFITKSISTLYKSITSPFIGIYNFIFSKLLKFSPIQEPDISGEDLVGLDKFINLIFKAFILGIFLGIAFYIYYYFETAKKILIFLAYYYASTLVLFVTWRILFAITNKVQDFISIIILLAVIPIIPLVTLIGFPAFPVAFILYYYLIPILLIVPLFLISLPLNFTLFIFSRFHLKNLMLFIGTLLFLLSKYIVYYSPNS